MNNTKKKAIRARNKARRAALQAPQSCPARDAWIPHGQHWWGPEDGLWCLGNARRVVAGEPGVMPRKPRNDR